MPQPPQRPAVVPGRHASSAKDDSEGQSSKVPGVAIKVYLVIAPNRYIVGVKLSQSSAENLQKKNPGSRIAKLVADKIVE